MAALAARRSLVWPTALAAAVLFVVVDLVQHPFRGAAPAGNAAERRQRVSLVLPGSELGGDSTGVVRLLATEARRRGIVVEPVRQRGGATAAVESVIGVDRGAQQRLLVVSGETLVQLEQDRRETIIPGVAERAARAWRRLAEARPLALLALDPVAVAVAERSPLRDYGDLTRELRRGRAVVGVGQDLWSRALLAQLVARSGVAGRVPYRPFAGAREAAAATGGHDARAVVGPRSALRRSGVGAGSGSAGAVAEGGAAGAAARRAGAADDGGTAVRRTGVAERGPSAEAGAAAPRGGSAASVTERRPGPTKRSTATSAPVDAASRQSGVVRLLRGAWPAGERPRQWVAIVAPAGEASPTARRLARLVRSAAWRRALRGAGLEPPPAGRAATRGFLAAERARASTLVRDLARVRARAVR
ncbi:hypothetical protein [Patulibacter defluvii]|uniref:hypothetical protein n=1 Tax=Patulibacter defluvii TaxID=3095358 RepID=UPI002A755606|nr:hypothetical protein [Patulibacter sp. DM4]